MTVEELLARITSWEITEHAAYLELEQAEMDKAKGNGGSPTRSLTGR